MSSLEQQTPGTSALEVEYKACILDRSAFQDLLAALPAAPRCTDQLNVYIDSKSAELAGARSTLRLRVTADRAELTVKSRRSVTGASWIADERTLPVDRDAARAWLSGDRAALDPLRFAGLAGRSPGDAVVVAWSRTLRHTCAVDGVDVELDETRFGDGTVDWEIEIEHSDRDVAAAIAQRLAVAAGVQLVAQDVSKSRRARLHRGDAVPPLPGDGGVA